MKKKKIIGIISIISILFISIIGVKALETNTFTHSLEIEAVLCPFENYSNLNGKALYDACAKDYLAGNLNSYILNANDSIEPGTLVMFVEKYIYGGKKEVIAFNTDVNYDNNKWEPIEISDRFYYYNTRNEYPYVDDIFTEERDYWTVSIPKKINGNIEIYGYYNRTEPLFTNINVNIFFLKLKENVNINSKLLLSFNRENTYAIKEINDGFDYVNTSTKDLTLRVSGNDDYINNIVSNKYTIKKDGETPIVFGAEPKTTIKEFISNFENEEKNLSIYDKNGELIADYNKYIGSYMTIKLKDNEEVKDSLTVVVKGDFDGDGIINRLDLLFIVEMIYGKYGTYLNNQIGDINLDNRITETDNVILTNYFTKSINSLN